MIDLPSGGACLMVFGAWLAIAERRFPWLYAVSAGPSLLLHAVLQSLVTGSPLPAEWYPESFLYPGSYWATAAGTFHETGPRWRFGLEMLIGLQGWLTITPVLWLGLTGVATVLAGKSPDMVRHRQGAQAVGSVLVLVLVFYIWCTRRTDFAGQSYGTRHLLALSPLVYYFAVDWLSRNPSPIESRFLRHCSSSEAFTLVTASRTPGFELAVVTSQSCTSFSRRRFTLPFRDRHRWGGRNDRPRLLYPGRCRASCWLGCLERF